MRAASRSFTIDDFASSFSMTNLLSRFFVSSKRYNHATKKKGGRMKA